MELLGYLLKASVCMVLFFAIYLLVLRKLTFFKINRFYLLFTLLLSFVIPTLQFTIEREATQVEAVDRSFVLQSENITVPTLATPLQQTQAPAVIVEKRFDWYVLLPYLYATIALGLLIISARRLFQLYRHTRQKTEELNGLKLVHKNKGFTNCSFFNYVFIDHDSLTAMELRVLLRHEEVHVKQYHSIDKVIMMIAKSVLWFNPIVYLYDTALEEAHEYEADEATSTAFGTEPYASLLLKLAVSKNTTTLVHNFVKSPIKKRIQMLFNSKSKNMKKLRYLLVFPIGLGLIWLLATEVVYANVKGLVKNQTIVENKPFIEKATVIDIKGVKKEKITINTNGRPLYAHIGYGKNDTKMNFKLWFYINDKLYSEAEAEKFDAAFIKNIPLVNGIGGGYNYEIANLPKSMTDYVFWFGNEPKLSKYGSTARTTYQKYNSSTITGKIEEFTYAPGSNSINGLMLKTPTGEVFKILVETKLAKPLDEIVAKGEEVSVNIFSTHQKESDFPVVSSFKLIKNDKVLIDAWPKATTMKMKVNGVEGVLVPVERDENKVKLIAVKPKLISSTNVSVDSKKKINYIKNGLMEISGDKLEAENIIWDMEHELIIAQNGLLKTKRGDLIKSEQITFALKTGTYQTSNPSLESKTTSAVYNLLSKMSYKALDSVRVNTFLNTLYLSGNVKLNIDGLMFNAKSVEVNKNSNLIKARHAILTDAAGLNVSGDLIEFDYSTKKYTVTNK
ncbi:M56 family metallopeptidase [Pedobacter sp. Hv1]|uniref:M56 family metallopeptidase n=1 Tax=Pedobacter sp. Hv1 TaxID=1740090 RepID=UPI0006D88ADD|nr:M56 family metallopeptidase [Pedobacter sp. Hv1]KQB99646.1 hypothetical protein AQF98_19030 [Pedobacter sp. Hv1]